MATILRPWQLLSVIVAGEISERQQQVVDYLKEENQVLREQLGDRRLRLTDDQRKRLAIRGRTLGRKLLAEVCCIVTPDTILCWHRKLIAEKYDGSARRGPGRPRVLDEIHLLVVRFALDNTSWGYTRIRDELGSLGHQVARSTVSDILDQHGILPAPERDRTTSWRQFLRAHWGAIAATDFLTVEVWTPRGLTRYWVLFVIDLSTRRVEIAGITSRPTAAWTERVTRSLIDEFDGFLRGTRCLIHDRDPLFGGGFGNLLRSAGVTPVRLPARSPNLNAYAERFVRSIKEECLSKLIIFGEGHLRIVIDEYVEHYHRERPHQGLNNLVLEPPDHPPRKQGPVVCRERVGGLLRSYHRSAA